jgi:hypothetical protein
MRQPCPHWLIAALHSQHRIANVALSASGQSSPRAGHSDAQLRGATIAGSRRVRSLEDGTFSSGAKGLPSRPGNQAVMSR